MSTDRITIERGNAPLTIKHNEYFWMHVKTDVGGDVFLELPAKSQTTLVGNPDEARALASLLLHAADALDGGGDAE